MVSSSLPGHANIPGNESADKLAKQGSTCTQHNHPVTLQTARQIIRQNMKEEWMNRWAMGTTGRSMFSHMTTPQPRDNINNLKRRDQVTIFRLRTTHVPLNMHLNRIQPQIAPACPLCPHPYETVQHHLFDCPALADLRSRFLPAGPDFGATLYGSTQQLLNTTKYHTMALCRRATAQRTAGSEK